MEELGNFAALKIERAEQTTMILTGDFGLTQQECSATVQKFNVTNTWRDWQMKATIAELPGDLIFVKNCVTKDLDVGLGSSWESTNPRRAPTELHDAVGAGVKMRLPFVVLNERTARQKSAELRAELKARLRAAKAENAEPPPKKLKTAAADGSHPVAQQSIAPRKPPVETAAAAGPQPVAQQTIASGGIPVDLSESEDENDAVEAIAPAERPNREGSLKSSAGDLAWSEDDTAAVEEHAEGGHVDGSLIVPGEKATGAGKSKRSKSKHPPNSAVEVKASGSDVKRTGKRRRSAAAGASQPAGDAPSGQSAAVAKRSNARHGLGSEVVVLADWFTQEFGAESSVLKKKVHDLLFQRQRWEVPPDLWENKDQPETVTCLASETHTVESIKAVLEERRAWMQAQGLRADLVMTQAQRKAYVADKKAEFENTSLQRGLIAKDLRQWDLRKLEKSKLAGRRHSRFHRMMQIKVGSKQNWEIISFTGTLDIDALREAQTGGAPEPAEDAPARRAARKEAIEARRCYCWGKTLKKRERSGEWTWEEASREDWNTLRWYNDDSLRQWANELTKKSGNGTIYNYDGTTYMLGGNMSRSITQRVLDRFQPTMRPEELDLTQYH